MEVRRSDTPFEKYQFIFLKLSRFLSSTTVWWWAVIKNDDYWLKENNMGISQSQLFRQLAARGGSIVFIHRFFSHELPHFQYFLRYLVLGYPYASRIVITYSEPHTFDRSDTAQSFRAVLL